MEKPHTCTSKMRNRGTFVVEELKGRHYLRDLGVDGRVTFKLMFK
jgi:hypothetical protein